MRERAYQEEQVETLEKRNWLWVRRLKRFQPGWFWLRPSADGSRKRMRRLRAQADESAASLRAAEETYAQKLAAAVTAETEIENARAELLTHTAVAERLREIARQLEGTIERLVVQAEGLAREGERATAQHAERKTEAENFG